MTEQSPAIVPVDSDTERGALRELLGAFHGWMADHAGEDYDPDAELAEDLRSLEHDPESWAWIARADGGPAGCVLLYGQSADLAEFRRLYVGPAHRGRGIGRALVRSVVDRARAEGYGTLGLTTPPWSDAAHALYESMGFERTPPYPGTRLPQRHHDEAIFMQLALDDPGSDGTGG